VFLMLSGVLGAWQTVFANSRRAQTRSIKGYVQIAQLACGWSAACWCCRS
jgi:miniconductance mechanosensitive channel